MRQLLNNENKQYLNEKQVQKKCVVTFDACSLLAWIMPGGSQCVLALTRWGRASSEAISVSGTGRPIAAAGLANYANNTHILYQMIILCLTRNKLTDETML